MTEPVPTVVTVIYGKEPVVKDAHLEVLPREGETLRIGEWRYKLQEVEDTLSTNPIVHPSRIFIR